MRDVKWAVLGTGVIANEMAVALGQSGRKIYAVGNRTHILLQSMELRKRMMILMRCLLTQM